MMVGVDGRKVPARNVQEGRETEIRLNYQSVKGKEEERSRGCDQHRKIARLEGLH